MHPCPAPAGGRAAGPRARVADIVRKHGGSYARSHRLDPQQRKVLHDIAVCRTPYLGGHLDLCPQCGLEVEFYNSCRNRHCPTCQAVRAEQWIEARIERLLPTKHFHVVFTLPAQLRTLTASNPDLVYDLLMKAAARTLQDLARDRLAATLGITAILHTWTRTILFHPHVHCIVSGGGLSFDERRWVPVRGRYLFPVKVLSRIFRGKFLHMLKAAARDGRLTGSLSTRPLYRTNWYVYAKPTFGSVDRVIEYLGRYTHRVAIANSRLLHVDASKITFRTRGSATATLTPDQFLGRFLLHVLPSGFRKIRHYGLYAPANVHRKLAIARKILPASPPRKVGLSPSLSPRRICPTCGCPFLRLLLAASLDPPPC